MVWTRMKSSRDQSSMIYGQCLFGRYCWGGVVLGGLTKGVFVFALAVAGDGFEGVAWGGFASGLVVGGHRR